MNTNSKHYEELNIQPWEIMERNFTNEEFVAYLKGNIIKYTLRDKGQALTDAQKIKHYAEKLIEVLKEKEEIKHYAEKLTEVLKEKEEIKPMIVKDSKFKVGDRVRLLAYLTRATGTIIRQPVIGLREIDKENYIVELDEGEEEGWEATKREHLVDSEHAWYVDDTEIELLEEEEPKQTLEPYKWYDAEDFTPAELTKLLPKGTTVLVTKRHDNDREVDLEEEETKLSEITNVGRRHIDHDTRVGVKGDCLWRRYFKIVEE